MKIETIGSLALVLVFAAAAPQARQGHGGAHQGGHDHGLTTRGNHGMGFDQRATTHHFVLKKDGGAIEVTANKDTDEASALSIRQHLQHIAKVFAEGDFALPMFIHGTEPPGAAVLRERKESMTYWYQEVPKGGRVEISTTDADALAALHAFLRYQITEHKTGDPITPR